MVTSMKMRQRTRLFWIINGLFLLQWVALAFNVNDRSAWVLENILVVVLVIPVVRGFLKNRISLAAYVLIFIFSSFHNLGAHYTYSEVPYDQWFRSVSGTTLSGIFGWQRNHYDRLVHFLFGLLLFLPLDELIRNFVRLNKFFTSLATVLLVTSISTVYELMEWAVAIVFHEGGGPEYIGTQGDEWDSQKDQALAIFGAVLAWTIYAIPGLGKFFQWPSRYWH